VATAPTSTADPPAATTTKGVLQASQTSGPNDPLTTAINPGHLFGPHGQPFAPRFLYVAGVTPTEAGQPGTGTRGHGGDVLIRAGTGFVQNFSIAHGDKLDLRKILAGAPLAHDLTNIDKFVRVLGYGKNDPGFGPGTKTSLEVTGPHGSAIVNLEGAGKLELHDLLKHHSLLLPPH
jgi:hypothetical protein